MTNFTPLSEPAYDEQHMEPDDEGPACRLGYSVSHGEYGLVRNRDFADFRSALSFHRQRRAYQISRHSPDWYCLQLQNDAIADGSEDGCGNGLTEAEQELVDDDSCSRAMLEATPSGAPPTTCGHSLCSFAKTDGIEVDIRHVECHICGIKWKEVTL